MNLFEYIILNSQIIFQDLSSQDPDVLFDQVEGWESDLSIAWAILLKRHIRRNLDQKLDNVKSEILITVMATDAARVYPL